MSYSAIPFIHLLVVLMQVPKLADCCVLIDQYPAVILVALYLITLLWGIDLSAHTVGRVDTGYDLPRYYY